MKFSRRVWMLPLLAVCSSLLQAADDYAALKARLLNGDFAIDFRALRLAYAETPAYHPNAPATLDFRRRTQAALQAKKYADVLAIGETWLTADYLNPFAHMGVARAHEALGHTEQARFHNRVLEGLYNSICVNGQGQSASSPCKVLSIDEEHFYLGRNRLQVGTQYGLECTGKIPCDVYEVRPAGGTQLYDVHFDISLPYAYSQRHPTPATSVAPAPPIK